MPGVGCGEQGEREKQRLRGRERAACERQLTSKAELNRLVGSCQANCSCFHRRPFAHILTQNPGSHLICLAQDEKYHSSTPPSACALGAVAQGCA